MSNVTTKIVPVVLVNVIGERRNKATNVLIRVGPNLVANGTLGGKWNPAQAFNEFKRNNPKFTIRKDMETVATLLKTMELPK